MLHYLTLPPFISHRGISYPALRLSYEVAGQALGSAPIILVNHALTGNSSVAGDSGWWGTLIGKDKTIDTTRYSILAFNIPGNGYDGSELEDPRSFSVYDVARLFLIGLELLGIQELYAIIGTSLGGGISWQMATLSPSLCRYLIPIATDYRASDWVLGQTLVQERILEHSSSPIEDARVHAMLCYRTPQSLNARFGGLQTREAGRYDIVSWLDYHGDQLRKRFLLSAYKVMTYLTASIYAAETPEQLAPIQAHICLVSIDSDLLFTHQRATELYEHLYPLKNNIEFKVIHSIHGHDAFLIEYEQLSSLLNPIFSQPH